MPDWIAGLLVTLLKAVLVALGLLTAFAYMTLIERRLLGRMQLRPGPNRVGPLGLLQPVADAIKSIFKEDLTVTLADKVVFTLAPILAIGMALTAFGGIPAGPPGSLFGTDPWVYNLDAGVLAVLALTSMGVYGIFLGGWASGSKYPMLGSLRSSAQMISYELGMGMSILGLLMLVGSTNLVNIVEWQAGPVGHGWMILFQIFGFALFMVSAFAEVNRTPFDLPEAEQELVAGYLTEYSSIKWALFQMAEYVNIMTASAMMSTLFFGGYRGPTFLEPFIPGISSWPLVWLIAKIAVFMFIFIWVRATLPRLRYDQLMRFGWKLTLPLALLNTMVTAGVLAFMPATPLRLWVLGAVSLALLLILFAASDTVRGLWNAPSLPQGKRPTRAAGGD
ncbi:NADH-quinone oxidoreductase subunit NuoH [Deinococcus sp. VB343]|uniref:NADH-quinone oxidoreductase subunit NuoH n=1 Tax=Deinococcus sp. VB343 TaxID=3385567 RepID=UPI0039C9258A